MKRGIFITATGTDVGKTYVTGLIVKALRDYGLNAGYYKAALSGAEYQNGHLVAGDCAYVTKTAGLSDDPNSLVSYIYQTAVSPHLAAEIENQPVLLSKIKQDFSVMKERFDVITVEGSGGIVCPLRLDEKTLMLTDIIKALELDIIIVASASLGTLNSIALTTEYAKSHEIAVKGIILNQYDETNFLHCDNKKQIPRLTGVPVISCIKENDTCFNMDTADLFALYNKLS